MYKILPGQGAAAEDIILTRLIPGPYIGTSAVTKIKCLRCGFISDYHYIDIHLWICERSVHVVKDFERIID